MPRGSTTLKTAVGQAQPFFLPLFTGVRGRGVQRSSHSMHSNIAIGDARVRGGWHHVGRVKDEKRRIRSC